MSTKIYAQEEMFDKAKEVKKAFQNDFKDSYKEMKSLYDKMSNDKGFQGKACEGFIELFDILLQYHKDLIEELPDFFKAFENYEESLDEIKSTSVYKELD